MLVLASLFLVSLNSSQSNGGQETDDSQKIYDALPMSEDVFNLRRSNLDMFEKLGLYSNVKSKYMYYQHIEKSYAKKQSKMNHYMVYRHKYLCL